MLEILIKIFLAFPKTLPYFLFQSIKIKLVDDKNEKIKKITGRTWNVMKKAI